MSDGMNDFVVPPGAYQKLPRVSRTAPSRKYKKQYGVFTAGGVYCYRTESEHEARVMCSALKRKNRKVIYLVWEMTPVYQAR